MKLLGGYSFLVLFTMVGAGVLFHYFQNKNSANGKWVGGEISWPKCFWLAYALGAWFLLPIPFVFSSDFPEAIRWVLVGHLASWWIRGVLELVMIYRWFNWTPIYGILHDMLHGLALTIGTIWAAGTLGAGEVFGLQQGFWAFFLVVGLIFFLVPEGIFAALFLTTRGKDPTIYFASDSPEYALINRLTRGVAVAAYLHTAILALGLLL